MKSKLNDAELIAEAYANVEVQEEGLGALAGGIGRGLAAAGRGIKKVAQSDTTKKIVRGAGNLASDVAKEAGAVAAEVGGEALRTAGKAAVGLADKAVNAADAGISKLAGDEEGDFPAADHDAPKGGIGSRSMDREELKARLGKAKSEGGIDKSDANDIMRMHDSNEDGEQAGHPSGSTELEARNARAHELAMAKAKAGKEDAEHAAPIEVDMSENPAPESLEISKEVEEPNHEPCAAMDVPSITVGAEMPEPMNHQDRSEMEMAKAELYKLEKYSFKLGQMLDHLPALEGWTASKITKAADYLSSVYHKLDYDLHGDDNGIKSEDHEGH